MHPRFELVIFFANVWIFPAHGSLALTKSDNSHKRPRIAQEPRRASQQDLAN